MTYRLVTLISRFIPNTKFVNLLNQYMRLAEYVLILATIIIISVIVGGIIMHIIHDNNIKEYQYEQNYIEYTQKLDNNKILLDIVGRTQHLLDNAGNKFKPNGLDLKSAQNLFSLLQTKYHLNDLKFSTSVINQEYDIAIVSNITIFSTDLSIKFSAWTDMLVYQFIDDLLKQFPGFIEITKLSITRVGIADKQWLSDLASGKAKPLIIVNMTAKWRNISINDE